MKDCVIYTFLIENLLRFAKIEQLFYMQCAQKFSKNLYKMQIICYNLYSLGWYNRKVSSAVKKTDAVKSLCGVLLFAASAKYYTILIGAVQYMRKQLLVWQCVRLIGFRSDLFWKR